MRVLVTGGAGYVGSHVVRVLAGRGDQVTVLDDLSTGHREAVPNNVELVHASLDDLRLVAQTVARARPDVVMHFAASSLVGESQANPGKYWRNNVGGTLGLVEAMVKSKVARLVFSSTAAVYGEPRETPIRESHPLDPTSTYGRTKVAVEMLLDSFAEAYGLCSIRLRYFNAAGAAEGGVIGEDHNPETHLVPVTFACALGLRDSVTVYGLDYPTSDGSCVRDYVHVDDLATAHVLAADYLMSHRGGEVLTRAFNLGNGRGFTVLEVIRACERAAGRTIPWVEGPRRPGDPAVLVASAELARRELGWQAVHTSLEGIVASAWAWHSSHPRGFAAADRSQAPSASGGRHVLAVPVLDSPPSEWYPGRPSSETVCKPDGRRLTYYRWGDSEGGRK